MENKNNQSFKQNAQNEFLGLDNDQCSSNERENKKEEEIPYSNIDEDKPTDPSLIVANITDQRAPIVLLFGAKSTGKTMTLVRLSRYLETIGAEVKVDPYFCTTAWEYKKNSKSFVKMKSTDRKLAPTNHNDFLFVHVVEGNTGLTVCQILEAAGEHYFPSANLVPEGKTRVNADFPKYMNDVFSTPNKKVWVFILDPTLSVQSDREDFVKRISFIKGRFNWHRDRAIILYNKIDETNFGGADYTSVKKAAAEEHCNGTAYKNVFKLFEGGFLESDRYTFVPFTTGYFSNGGYTASDDSFPKALWNSIKNAAGIQRL